MIPPGTEQEQRPVIIVASGPAGIGTARAAITWDALAASATEQPVVVVYLAEAKESAAFMLEWDNWKAMGVHLFPVYIFDGTSDGDGQNGGSGKKAAKLLPQQDRCVQFGLEHLFYIVPKCTLIDSVFLLCLDATKQHWLGILDQFTLENTQETPTKNSRRQIYTAVICCGTEPHDVPRFRKIRTDIRGGGAGCCCNWRRCFRGVETSTS